MTLEQQKLLMELFQAYYYKTSTLTQFAKECADYPKIQKACTDVVQSMSDTLDNVIRNINDHDQPA